MKKIINKKGYSVFDKDYYRYLLHRKPWKIPHTFIRDVQFACQRVSRGYADSDLFSIRDWLMILLPDMLQDYKETRMGSPASLGENYTAEDGTLMNDACHKEWDKILDEMIRLFRDMGEDTCSRKNSYEKEYDKAFKEFSEKYGFFGRGLETAQEKKDKNHRTVHFMDELSEYKEISDKYHEEERRLDAYRDECKDKAFEMLSKYFWDLWD